MIATYVPQSDLVQEFRVQTATFDSQFGNTEGGVTSMSIKSGTNAFHGSAYYFAEPSSMGANDFFGKARGQGKIESNSNRPGFTLGGPSGSGALQRQDKTLLHVRLRTHHGHAPAFRPRGDPWVPTEALRNGDFSGVLAVHHDLRSADARARGTAGSSSDSRSPATSSRRTGSTPSQRRSWSTTACPRTRA